MDSFNEMHGFCYEFQATVSATVCYSITADQISPLVGSVFVDVNFMTRDQGKIFIISSLLSKVL
jgi:hypothetical protein